MRGGLAFELHFGKSPAGDGKLLGAGLDISKEGIRSAARDASGNVWCVGDLARCPFQDGTFDFVLSMLSPSNYAEFLRVLADEGMAVKVIPEAGYLQELREMLRKSGNGGGLAVDHRAELFEQHFDPIEVDHLDYTIAVKDEDMQQLLLMTPLAWGAAKEFVERAAGCHSGSVRIELSILYGRK